MDGLDRAANPIQSSPITSLTPETSRTLSGAGAVGLPSRFDSDRAASSGSLLPMIPEWPGDHLNLRSIPARQSDVVLCAILASRARRILAEFPASDSEVISSVHSVDLVQLVRFGSFWFGLWR